MLEISDLEVSYTKNKVEHTVIKHLNLGVADGKILALVGRSGCGKTTLLNAIAGIKEYKGTMEIDGKELSPKSTPIGLIPQDYGLLAWQTVIKNCLFAVDGKNPQMKKMAEQMMEELDILKLANHYPGEISGGQAQRVALCRALLLKPQILLMDEPFSALDEAAAREAEILTTQLLGETDAMGIIITHRIEEALFLADEILVMKADGTGTMKASFLNPWKGNMDVMEQEYLKLKGEIEQAIMEREGE